MPPVFPQANVLFAIFKGELERAWSSAFCTPLFRTGNPFLKSASSDIETPMKLAPDQLQQALKGCIAGDRRCQQQVFQQFFGKMMTVCMRYTKDRDTAQDILQDAFIKAFDKMSDYSFSGSFEGWLRRIVVNTAIDHFRRSRHLILLEENSAGAATDEDDAPDVMEDEQESSIYDQIKPEMVMEAMQKLSPAYRTVFNLYVFENYSHKEIAEALQVNIGTSKSNLAKARMKLKVLLQKQLSYK